MVSDTDVVPGTKTSILVVIADTLIDTADVQNPARLKTSHIFHVALSTSPQPLHFNVASLWGHAGFRPFAQSLVLDHA